MAAFAPFNLFNADWYLAQNPDVAEAVRLGLITAEQQFQQYGGTEGRAHGREINGAGSATVLASDGDEHIVMTNTGNNTITAGKGADQIILTEGGGEDVLIVHGGTTLSDLPDALAAAQARLNDGFTYIDLNGADTNEEDIKSEEQELLTATGERNAGG